MAGRKKTEYVSHAQTTKIAISSRASVKVKESYYTVEYSEERAISDVTGVDIEKERQMLWDTCNSEVDNQIEDILKNLK